MASIDGFGILPYYVGEVVSWIGLAVSLYLAWRGIRAYERRLAEPERLLALARRVQSLETTVEAVEGQVRQASEAQYFTTALLTGRPDAGRRAGVE